MSAARQLGPYGFIQIIINVPFIQMLAHDFKQIELQRLKAQAQKIPPKIRVFSFVMLVCFLLTYLAIICYVALESLGGMF